MTVALISSFVVGLPVAQEDSSSILDTFSSTILNNEFANSAKKLIYNIQLVTV